MNTIDLQAQHGTKKPFIKPVTLTVTFYFPYHAIKKRRAAQQKSTPRPDIDNLCKFLLDTLVYAQILSDDRIVHTIHAIKLYDMEARTEFTIIEEE